MPTGTKFNNFPAFILREVEKSVSSVLHCSPFLTSASSSGGIRLFVMKVCRDAWEITSFHLLRNGIQVNQERSQQKLRVLQTIIVLQQTCEWCLHSLDCVSYCEKKALPTIDHFLSCTIGLVHQNYHFPSWPQGVQRCDTMIKNGNIFGFDREPLSTQARRHIVAFYNLYNYLTNDQWDHSY